MERLEWQNFRPHQALYWFAGDVGDYYRSEAAPRAGEKTQKNRRCFFAELGACGTARDGAPEIQAGEFRVL